MDNHVGKGGSGLQRGAFACVGQKADAALTIIDWFWSIGLEDEDVHRFASDQLYFHSGGQPAEVLGRGRCGLGSCLSA